MFNFGSLIHDSSFRFFSYLLPRVNEWSIDHQTGGKPLCVVTERPDVGSH
ncbi:MAG: hypothetical protein RL726_350 [Actinomycetota bacterium]